MAHRVTLIPGDGTGPELTEATRRVLEATGVELDWDVREAGADVMDKYGGNPLPDEVLPGLLAQVFDDGACGGIHQVVVQKGLSQRLAGFEILQPLEQLFPGEI